MNSLLGKLVGLEFEVSVIASTPGVLHALLSRTAEVLNVRRAYDTGEVTSVDIETFVNDLLDKDRLSPRFPYQTQLAAIAVALQTRINAFSEAYLKGLAHLQGERFAMASRIARIAFAQRQAGITNSYRGFSLSLETPTSSQGWEAQDYNEKIKIRTSPTSGAYRMRA